MDSTQFYKRIEPFTDFDQVSELESYQPLPDDWALLLADVVHSTKAVAEGRYKDVNLVGAASITAVLNISGNVELPFVFGGDGSVLAVPPALREKAEAALINLRARTQQFFGLELRVGSVTVSQLRDRGFDVRLRKFQLSDGNYLAMFAGGGVEQADDWLKDPASGAEIQLPWPEDPGEPDLEGLSCRWEPLKAQAGQMITIMVRGTNDKEEHLILGEVMHRLAEILGHSVLNSAPVNERTMRLSWPPKAVWQEARATSGGRSVLLRALRILAEGILVIVSKRFGIRFGHFHGPTYQREMESNTDFRKYDGILRMVLDVTKAQAKAIDAYLAGEFDKGRLIYGLHLADEALMTCIVFNLAQSRHVHLIDGSEGGFTEAAKAYKHRMLSLGLQASR